MTSLRFPYPKLSWDLKYLGSKAGASSVGPHCLLASSLVETRGVGGGGGEDPGRLSLIKAIPRPAYLDQRLSNALELAGDP